MLALLVSSRTTKERVIIIEERHIIESIDEQEIIAFLQTLVRTNSENPPGNEMEVGHIIANELETIGCHVELQMVEKGRFNVIGIIEGESKEKLLFNGHMDTVKAGDVDAWDDDPFGGEIHNGKLFGRGSTDMKAGLTSMIFALKAVLHSGVSLKKGIMFTAVIDEEVFFKGTKALIDSHKLRDCEWGFVSEPSSLNIATRQKGGIEFLARTYGKSAHAGVAFSGDNAIYKMNKVVDALERYNETLKARMNLPFLKHPTVNVGRIQGGTGVTFVPDFCEIEFDRQVLPGENIETVTREVTEVIELLEKQQGINVELNKIQQFNTWEVSVRSQVVTMLASAYKKLFHREPIYSGFNGYSEVELLANNGIPSVIFGPGDITLAHVPNENVQIQEVIDAAKVYALVAYNYVRGQ